MLTRNVVTCFLEHEGMLLEHEGMLLVLRRSQDVMTHRGKWAGVSGSIEAHSALDQALNEIAEETGLSQEDVYDTFEVVKYGRPLSLDAKYSGSSSSEASTLLDYVGNEDPQFDRLSDRMDLASTMGCLDRRERTIILLKFYGGLSQTEIARRLGISQMHVSRLQRVALAKLRLRLTG